MNEIVKNMLENTSSIPEVSTIDPKPVSFYDFNDHFEVGDYLWFVRIYPNQRLKFKPIQIHVRRLDERCMYGVLPSKQTVLIGVNQIDQIFGSKEEADLFYETLTFSDMDDAYAE